MLAATVFSAIVLATGVASFLHDLQYAASDENQYLSNQYQYLVLLIHGGNSGANSAEDITAENGLDFHFANQLPTTVQGAQPPRPTFPVHLQALQNNHPQGDDYWQGLQGDHAHCPVIQSCPARYGCYVMQKPGIRCAYCKCASRTPNKIDEH